MTLDNLSYKIINSLDELCYIADIKTYKLLFLNNSAKKLFKITDDNYFGLKCHKILYKNDTPCSFCKNYKLKKDEFQHWEFYNEFLKKHYLVRNTLIEVDGQWAHLEFAIDRTKRIAELKKINSILSFDDALLRCTHTLLAYDDINTAINTLLFIFCDYHKGSRAYIFENDTSGKKSNKTYEWCDGDVDPEKERLEEISVITERWTEIFEKDTDIFIASFDKDLESTSIEYQVLVGEGLRRLMVVPLRQDDKIKGFLGIDDPTVNIQDTRLIRTIALFIMDDIQKRRLLLNFERLSYIDTMTGVFNRNKYLIILEEYQQKPPTELGIVFVDVNGLKKINDTYGHTYGDHLICSSVKLIQKFFSKNIFRVGGDEFVCFITDMSKKDFTKKTAGLRQATLAEKEVSLSIGAMWNTDIVDIEKQIAKADNLMYIEKQKYYRSVLGGKTTPRIGIAQSLVQAVKDHEFIVHLQPKVDLLNRKVISAEALVRQRAPNGALIFPDKFIPIYEEEGVIGFIDLFVLETVCKTLQKWKKLGSELPIAVNFSRVTIMEHDIVSSIAAICDKYEVEHGLIEIEVTERVGKLPEEIVNKFVDDLKKAGFKITLDDFGAEYSNLVSLANMDFQEVKMDKSLIDKLLVNKKNQVILQSVIDMCNSFVNTATLAEGVESAEQAELLSLYNCKRGQGYFFSKPISIEEFYDLFVLDFKK